MFIIVSAIILLGIFIYSPINAYLMDNGYIEYENVGNKITPEKVYGEDEFMSDFFNSIENGKCIIKDTYINHLPGYLKITSDFGNFKTNVNKDFTKALRDKGEDIVKENMENYRKSLEEKDNNK